METFCNYISTEVFNEPIVGIVMEEKILFVNNFSKSQHMTLLDTIKQHSISSSKKIIINNDEEFETWMKYKSFVDLEFESESGIQLPIARIYFKQRYQDGIINKTSRNIWTKWKAALSILRGKR